MGVEIRRLEPLHSPCFGTVTEHVTICIPAYEPSDKLKRTLWFVEQTLDMPATLVVVTEKQSVAKNRNECLSYVRDDVVAFLDDDVMLPPGWLTGLVSTLDSDDRIGAVAPKVTSPNGEPQNILGGIARNQYTIAPVPGMCFVYSRKRTAGCTFDERYIASQFEDADFMYQVLYDAKKLVICTGSVWILHDNEKKQANEENWKQNSLLFDTKWKTVAQSSGAIGKP